MNQEKIGKLIAKLRKSKNLTQRELGEMVGVGFRAVSKWETGLTAPDISIINDLSKILGISADELLKGEMNNKKIEEERKPINIFAKIITLLIIILFTSAFIINKNQTQIYDLGVYDNSYYIEGELHLKNKSVSLKINKFDFDDNEFNSTIIKNYQYEITCDGVLIVGYGYIPAHQALPIPTTIEQLYDQFNVNYNGDINVSKSKLIKKGMNIEFTFIDNNNKTIIKNTKIKIKREK